jgi:hypothetical protein
MITNASPNSSPSAKKSTGAGTLPTMALGA